jgi:hypothetical protein
MISGNDATDMVVQLSLVIALAAVQTTTLSQTAAEAQKFYAKIAVGL